MGEFDFSTKIREDDGTGTSREMVSRGRGGKKDVENKSMNVMKICRHVGIGRAVHISTIPRGGMENGVGHGIETGFWIALPCIDLPMAIVIVASFPVSDEQSGS